MIRQLAHEIRNPLGGLRGAAQLLERELPTPELREFTRIIIGEADRLTSLTDSLLGPVRRPQRQDVNVHEVLERVVALIGSERREAVQLFRDYDPSLPPLSADPDQLIQALLNIARNAMQAIGPDGHVLFRTRALTNFAIGAVRHKLVLSIEIEDDGPGRPGGSCRVDLLPAGHGTVRWHGPRAADFPGPGESARRPDRVSVPPRKDHFHAVRLPSARQLPEAA